MVWRLPSLLADPGRGIFSSGVGFCIWGLLYGTWLARWFLLFASGLRERGIPFSLLGFWAKAVWSEGWLFAG